VQCMSSSAMCTSVSTIPLTPFPKLLLGPGSAARVRLGPEVTFTKEPCIVGETIELRAALQSPAMSRPVAFVDGIEVAPLLADLSRFPTWEHLLRQWSERLPSWKAERLATWLWEKRVLCKAVASDCP
jgi:hypothetical protein